MHKVGKSPVPDIQKSDRKYCLLLCWWKFELGPHVISKNIVIVSVVDIW